MWRAGCLCWEEKEVACGSRAGPEGPLMGSGEGAVGLSASTPEHSRAVARQVVPAWESDPHDPKMPSPSATSPLPQTSYPTLTVTIHGECFAGP